MIFCFLVALIQTKLLLIAQLEYCLVSNNLYTQNGLDIIFKGNEKGKSHNTRSIDLYVSIHISCALASPTHAEGPDKLKVMMQRVMGNKVVYEENGHVTSSPKS